MGIQDTAWHLACLKAQLEQVKSADEPGVCFLAFSRAGRDAILHIDLSAELSRLKNPRVICPRLQNAWKLQSEQYESFFEDPEPLWVTRDISALCILASAYFLHGELRCGAHRGGGCDGSACCGVSPAESTCPPPRPDQSS